MSHNPEDTDTDIVTSAKSILPGEEKLNSHHVLKRLDGLALTVSGLAESVDKLVRMLSNIDTKIAAAGKVQDIRIDSVLLGIREAQAVFEKNDEMQRHANHALSVQFATLAGQFASHGERLLELERDDKKQDVRLDALEAGSPESMKKPAA